MRFGILGSLEVCDDEGRPLSLAAPKQQAVLAVLLLHANEVVSSDRLIEDLWAGGAPASAATALQMHVSRLRRRLGDGGSGGEGRLLTASGGYLLRVAPGELDAKRFEQMVEEGEALARAEHWDTAAERLRAALGLWRGRPLSDFEYESFAQPEIARLSELHVSAVEQRVAAEIAVGREAQVIAELERLVREHPYRERLRCQLMLALYRTGRQAEALEAYRDARAVLVGELGIEPSAELRQLQEAILAQDGSLASLTPHRTMPAGEDGQPRAPATGQPVAPGERAPEGTVALLFTDVEGSTRLASELGASWSDVLADHHAIVAGAIAEEGGFVSGTGGDSFVVTFSDAQAAARAAVAAMRRLRSHPWPPAIGELKVRMGLHVGHVERTASGYVGLEMHRAARVADAAHGGQLLITAAARALVGDRVQTEALGEHRLKDFPAPELLYCAVIDGRGAASFPPPRTQQIRATNLPAGLPPLVGREHELERVRDALIADRERIVTLTGRGGVGKTSLALTVAAGLLDEHPGGVWLIRLAAIASPGDVLPTIAGVVGAKGGEGDSPLDAISARLSGRGPTLLVLDNLEHLLAAARSVAGLLQRAPDVRVLVTSQAPLRLTGERCLPVGSLGEDAALVLIERVARRREATFRVTDDDRVVLAEIVTMLDGLPLALELAAARLGVLTAAQLRDRLRVSADVLRDDVRDRIDRQRSLRATVEWTLESLDVPARQLFVRLGAFAGPVDLSELEQVAGADGLDVLDALSCLREVALLRRVEDGDGRVRFAFPEAIRQIAAATLDSAPDGERWRREHAARQLELQWAARTSFLSPRPVHDAAVAADAEAATALRWARDLGDPMAEPLAAASATLLVHSGRFQEALAALQPLLDSPPADPEVYGQALTAYAWALENAGKREEALVVANTAVDLLTGEALALALIVRAYEQAALGQVELALGDNERATALARDLGTGALGNALRFEGQTRLDAGQPDLAAALFDEADQVCADTILSRHSYDGDLALARHQPQLAAHHYALSLEFAQRRRDHLQVFNDFIGLAYALAMNNDDIAALEVSGIAEAHINGMGGSTRSAWHIQGHAPVLEAEKRLGADAAAEARTRGREVDAGYRVTRACELAQGTKRLMH